MNRASGLALLMAGVLLVTSVALAAESPQTGVNPQKQVLLGELQKRYPDSKIVEVSPDQLEQMQRDGRSTHALVAQSGDPAQVKEVPLTEKKKDYCARRVEATTANSDGHFSLNFYGSGWSSGSKGDGAAVLFVVIGLVVAVVFVAYAVSYLGRMVYGAADECIVRWWEVGLQTTWIEDQENGYHRSGVLGGVEVSTGLGEPERLIGLVADVGYADIQILTSGRGTDVRMMAPYWMVGPGLYIRPFYLQLLSGTAFHQDIGLLSVARFGVNFELGGGWRTGFNLGATLMNQRVSQGILTSLGSFAYSGGLTLGIQF